MSVMSAPTDLKGLIKQPMSLNESGLESLPGEFLIYPFMGPVQTCTATQIQ